jgi:hypothetical protein
MQGKSAGQPAYYGSENNKLRCFTIGWQQNNTIRKVSNCTTFSNFNTIYKQKQ